jgi:hypothetical protein
MKTDQKGWLEEHAVSCRVFKGRWSIRHCLRMYNDIKDLRIHMSSRVRGKVTRYESAYNPCERCKILTKYIDSQPRDPEDQSRSVQQTYDEARVA